MDQSSLEYYEQNVCRVGLTRFEVPMCLAGVRNVPASFGPSYFQLLDEKLDEKQ